MKHLCPSCGKFIKWALLLCFDCNARLVETNGVEVVGGSYAFPQYEPHR